jgi:hypothetical protein
MTNRPTYLTLPGPSVTTVLLNLPNILNTSGEPPLILMDTHDYEELRAEILTGDVDGKKAPYLIAAYDDLYRRGVLRLIDYKKHYSPTDQEYNLQQNQGLLREVSEPVNRKAAIKASKGWIHYGRGDYQVPFRGALGESPSTVNDLRKSEESQHRKLKRGTHNPIEWNEKILNKGVAGLSVCESLNRDPNINVQGVICHSGYGILDDFLDLAHNDAINTDISHIKDLDPNNRITGFNSEIANQTREILDTVSEVATQLSGVQYNDWLLLGQSFAIPQYQKIFDFDIIHYQVEDRFNINELVSDTEQVIDALENSTNTISSDEIQYETEWMTESFELPTGRKQSEGLMDMVHYAVTISNYANELRTLVEQHNISQAAALIGANIVRNPYYQYDEHDLYRRCVDLMVRFDPPSVDKTKLERVHMERQNETWEEHTDWFEAINRKK